MTTTQIKYVVVNSTKYYLYFVYYVVLLNKMKPSHSINGIAHRNKTFCNIILVVIMCLS